MEIHYNDKNAAEVWQKIERHMQLMRMPYQSLLKGCNIWLGKNPRPNVRSTNRGYYSPANKDIVITENGFYQNSSMASDDMIIYMATKTLGHEIGHHIHFSYLPYHSQAKRNPGRWKEWSEATGHELQFERGDHFGNQGVVPAYEHFANDFRDWVLRSKMGTGRKKFYYGLWGQKYMAEVMLKIGSKDIYLDGEKVGELDIPVRIEKGRTVLELRGIGEVLGAEFDWEPKEGKTKEVYIYR